MNANPEFEKNNPYVGPRPYEYGERIYGRGRETLEIRKLLLYRRVILLHAPSGAGKTSLIQAGLVRELERQGLAVPLPYDKSKPNPILPCLRVNREPPGEQATLLREKYEASYNRYLYSLFISLEEALPEEARSSDEDLAQLSLPAFLEQRLAKMKQMNIRAPANEVWIFDQFEEVLSLDPTDQDKKAVFFAQLGKELFTFTRLAIFSMRDDFVGSLEPLLEPMPDRLRSRFHLDMLNEAAAKQAIIFPAKANGVTFFKKAAKALIDDLRLATIQKPDGTPLQVKGPYIEPVQLQVVCRLLWKERQEEKRIRKEDQDLFLTRLRQQETARLSGEELAGLTFVDYALGRYFADSVQEVAERFNLHERIVRDWFTRQLITSSNFRSQVMRGPGESQGLPNDAIEQLVKAHLVRREERRGLVWYELAHDRLVRPVQLDNRRWFQTNLKPFQLKAIAWEGLGRPETSLLSGGEYAEALQSVKAGDTSPLDEEFLKQSRKKYEQEDEVRRLGLGTNLVDIGWGILFPADVDAVPILQALKPLLDHRRKESQTHRPNYGEFTGPDLGYRIGQSAQDWLRERGAASGPPNPSKVPYYLLIIASPDKIPFEFQYDLDETHAVGRLYFPPDPNNPNAHLYQYASYAQSVVNAETGRWKLARRMGVIVPEYPSKSAQTRLLQEELAAPLINSLKNAYSSWQIVDRRSDQASRMNIADLLGGKDTPAFLVTATLGEKRFQSKATAYTGALLSTPTFGSEPNPRDDFLTAGDIPDEARLGGLLAFLYGDSTAGVSGEGQSTPQSALSPLALRLLSHPLGGALAVIGHVDAVGAMLDQDPSRLDFTALYDCFNAVLNGKTAGMALDELNHRHTLLRNALLNALLEPTEEEGQKSLRAAMLDARNYLLLGDPAARLPEVVEMAEGDQRPFLGEEEIPKAYRFALLSPQARAEQALEEARASSNRNAEARALDDLGDAYAYLGEADKALENYQQALSIYRELGDRSGEAKALFNCGTAYDGLNKKKKALENYQQALSIYRELGDRSGEAKALFNCGTAYDGLNKKKKALENYQQALPIYQELGDRSGEAMVLIYTGIAYDSLRNEAKALENYQQALSICRELGDRSGEATALFNCGTAYNGLGNKKKALENYQQALPIYQELGDRSGEAITLQNLGFTNSDMGNSAQALKYLKQALVIHRKLRDRGSEARVLSDIGVVYYSLENKAKALEYYNKALSIYHEVGDDFGIEITESYIASLESAVSTPVPESTTKPSVTAPPTEAPSRVSERGLPSGGTTISGSLSYPQPVELPTPPSDSLIFNGLSARTGQYALATSDRMIADLARSETPDRAERYRLRAWYEYKTASHFGVPSSDLNSLGNAGWGMIVPEEFDRKTLDALQPLIEQRRISASVTSEAYFKSDPFIYRRGDTIESFLSRYGVSLGRLNPEKLPYYLLILGNPEKIPFTFQTMLSAGYAVGRLDFDTPDEYNHYATSVVRAERASLPQRLGLFCPANAGDLHTALLHNELILPLYKLLLDEGRWDIQAILSQQASFDNLRRWLEEGDNPTLMLLAGQGLVDPFLKSQLHGGLVCQAWPGPQPELNPIHEAMAFTSSDLSDKADLTGLICFLYNSFSVGMDCPDPVLRKLYEQGISEIKLPFTASLPRHMLSLEAGAAQAVIGFCGPTLSFYGSDVASNSTNLVLMETIIKQLGYGSTIGAAMEPVSLRYAELFTGLASLLEEIDYGRQINPGEIRQVWADRTDKRMLTLLGDPAVRLPIANYDNIASEQVMKKVPSLKVKPLGAEKTDLQVSAQICMAVYPTAVAHLLNESQNPYLRLKAVNDSYNPISVAFEVAISGYSVSSNQIITLKPQEMAEISFFPRLFPEAVTRLEENARAELSWLSITPSGEPKLSDSSSISLLSRKTLPLAVRNPSSGGWHDLSYCLRAFITPDDPAVRAVLAQAAKRLPEGGITGYQGNLPDQIKAIVDTLEITLGFTSQLNVEATSSNDLLATTLPRLPAVSLESKQASSLEAALLLTSLLVAADLNPTLTIFRSAQLNTQLGVLVRVEERPDSGEWQFVRPSNRSSLDSMINSMFDTLSTIEKSLADQPLKPGDLPAVFNIPLREHSKGNI